MRFARLLHANQWFPTIKPQRFMFTIWLLDAQSLGSNLLLKLC
jgi:hypothetical protein